MTVSDKKYIFNTNHTKTKRLIEEKGDRLEKEKSEMSHHMNTCGWTLLARGKHRPQGTALSSGLSGKEAMRWGQRNWSAICRDNGDH